MPSTKVRKRKRDSMENLLKVFEAENEELLRQIDVKKEEKLMEQEQRFQMVLTRMSSSLSQLKMSDFFPLRLQKVEQFDEVVKREKEETLRQISTPHKLDTPQNERKYVLRTPGGPLFCSNVNLSKQDTPFLEPFKTDPKNAGPKRRRSLEIKRNVTPSARMEPRVPLSARPANFPPVKVTPLGAKNYAGIHSKVGSFRRRSKSAEPPSFKRHQPESIRPKDETFVFAEEGPHLASRLASTTISSKDQENISSMSTTAVNVLRWQKPGEEIFSRTGSPVAPYIGPFSELTVNIASKDRVVRLQPTSIANADDQKEMFENFDPETLKQIKEFSKDLNEILKTI